MYTKIRALVATFLAKTMLFLDIVSGMDDLHGDYVSNAAMKMRSIEEEVRRLQARVRELEDAALRRN